MEKGEAGVDAAAPPPRLPVRRLRCSVQNYDWGRAGDGSTVGRLYSRNSGSEVEADRPYAEFWMGTHDSGPSFLVGDEAEAETTTLKSWIQQNPGVLGDKVVERWGCDLPFLFKVLSVAKALSIQAHPDKELAGLLHRTHPGLYKDSNHKPEMAVAISEFRALCGFVSLEELKNVFANVPEILELVGEEDSNEIIAKDQFEEVIVKDLLRSIFTKFMEANSEVISVLVGKLKLRLSAEIKVRPLTEKESLALELEKQYPDDVGVISSFFFNYVKLKPGEALYLGPNEPHAYISGECIECMATSDNVVRAGLTPKYRDVQTLCSMLTYKQGFPEILHGVSLNPFVVRYIPPFDEFEVDCCLLPFRESVEFPVVSGPSLFVVLAGEGDIQTDYSEDKETVKEGDVFFVPAGTRISLIAGASGTLRVYRAGVNGRFFE